MRAFIFAAGIGSRLRPLTDRMPKALVPLAGRPLIDRVVERLKGQGVDSFVVNVHHFADMLCEYIAGRDDADMFAISDESDMLRDTGGAVKHAAELLKGESFLIHNVDIVSNFDLRRMLESVRPGALATLLVSERVTQRYLLFDADMRLVGWMNEKTGEVKSPHRGLDVESCRKSAFAGIHYLSPEVLDLMSEYGERFSIIDFYLEYAAKYEIYGYIQPDLKLTDVGKPESLAVAERMIENGSGSLSV